MNVDDKRLATLTGLGRALRAAGGDLQQILDQLAVALESLCDGCSIQLGAMSATRGSSAEGVAMPFPRGAVTVTRPSDLETITACLEYASLAIEGALRVERTAQFQKQMLGMVGHDLRAPLGSIVVGIELLEMDVKHDREALSVVKRIEGSAGRINRMIDQLLDLTRARLGAGLPVERRKTQLIPIITSVINELALADQIEVIGADIGGTWDPGRLGQVLANLVSNAQQYGLEGAPILIELGTGDGGATITVHNTIRDEPIPPATLARLFEPDRRSAHDIRHSASGLGIGLYLASEIVRAHGGSIAAASEGSRTSMRVVLPVG